ncbi:MAG TPA: peptidoglycan-binding domain-containing protein [Rhodoblastus sp.]|nr:peptidoglycan-binding domain-containing protein [Rhodoblastus sp.]
MRKAARKDLDFDLDYDDERPAKAAPKPKRARLSATRVGMFGLGALSLAIVVNAAFLQDQRRSAPLFKITLADEAKPAPTAEPPALPPLPPVRVVEAPPQPAPKVVPPEPPRTAPPAAKVDLIARELNRGDAPAPRAEKPAIAEARAEKPQPRPAPQRAEPRRNDAIGGLIEKTGVASSAKAREPATSDVLAAQRALQRLGFVVRPNGVFDATTRQAIEQFERDRKMPARGELTPTVKRELARLSAGET